MKFWMMLFCVNGLFFISGYFLNFKDQPNPLAFIFGKKETPLDHLKSIYARESSDPFRILLEYTVCLLAMKLFGFIHFTASIILALLATLGFVSTTYTYVMVYIFNRPPVLRSDIEFLKVGMTIAYKWKFLIGTGVVFILGGVFYLFTILSAFLLVLEVSSFSMVIGIFLLTGLGLYNVMKYRYHSFHHRTVYSFVFYFLRNYSISKQYDYLLSTDRSFFEKFNIYKDIQLTSRPNVVIISVESYGSIVFKEPELKELIDQTFKTYTDKFAEKNFTVRSGLSRPPQFGGGSWLSYTSLLFGMRVDDMNQYNLLFKSNSAFKYYQSMLAFLKSNGYKNYLLCPLGGDYNDQVDWDVVKMNFSSDEFLDWDRMDYVGKKYQYLKLGYSPSDQYSIQKADEIISESGKEPYSLFFSTLNSHVPFDSPECIDENWKDLNVHSEDKLEDRKLNSSLFSRYKTAINFQLNFILNFIEQKDDENTIYILFGDHQPPFITKREMGYSTPIHIIGKNAAFVHSYEELAFCEGFYPELKEDASMNHEGFYSFFMKAFNKTFGKIKNLELPYLPLGIQLNEEH